MSDFIDVILGRRSIRTYKADLVSEDIIQSLLKAAMYAPSARNAQSWQFIVVTDRKILDTLADSHPYGKMLKEAPLAIVVLGDMKRDPDEGYVVINCAAATQNILLAAHAQNLGSVWLGVYPKTDRMSSITEIFKLPEHIIPLSLIAIGYPNEEKALPQRFAPDKIHYNTW